MIKTLNLNRQTTAILQNAYAISYEKQVNAIWQASFSLPLNDPKVDKVELLKYVLIDEVGLFRVIPKLTVKNQSTQEVRFQCEHVLATLLDSSLFKYHQMSNFTTNQVLDYLFARQKTVHWRKGTVDFTRYFHYSWENENLASSIFSVPRPFNEPYIWEHDTTSYPWTLSLNKPDDTPVCRIKEGYNLIGLEIEENPMGVYNRIYPLGAGEGVNQLGIDDVNNGIPYLEDREPDEEIKEYIWVDRRFTDAEMLKASGQALLDKWKKPIVTWKVSAAEVSKITGLSIDKFTVGKVVRIDVEGFPTTDLRIMKESRPDMIGSPGNVQLELGNVQEDLSTTYSDLERRQQINELYSNGATNIDSHSYQDNADPQHPAKIRFYLDEGLVNINTMTLTYEIEPFRAYSRAIEGGGALVDSTAEGGGVYKSTEGGGGVHKSTEGGGGVHKSTEGGGGTSTSTESGGGGSETSSQSNGWEVNLIPYTSSVAFPTEDTHRHVVTVDMADFDHTHTVNIPVHSHDFTIPSHTHNFELQPHTHDFELEPHAHDFELEPHVHQITLPNHEHEILHGIFELNRTPSFVEIRVDGNLVPMNGLRNNDIDIIPYLSTDSNGKIIRGTWHEVTITPNDLGRVTADIISRLFIQSQIGGNF